MRALLAIVLLLVLSNCDNKDNCCPSGQSIDFYYISEYQTIDNTFKIIDSSVKISNDKIIDYSDILSYSSKDFTFKVNDDISDFLKDTEDESIHGTPFAITIDKELVYTGYFWASYSSQGCDWITIDPIHAAYKNELTVRLGYPGMIIGDSIPDNRNDSRLLEVLKQDNKLKD